MARAFFFLRSRRICHASHYLFYLLRHALSYALPFLPIFAYHFAPLATFSFRLSRLMPLPRCRHAAAPRHAAFLRHAVTLPRVAYAGLFAADIYAMLLILLFLRHADARCRTMIITLPCVILCC